MQNPSESQSSGASQAPGSRRTWLIAGTVVAILATLAAGRAITAKGELSLVATPAKPGGIATILSPWLIHTGSLPVSASPSSSGERLCT